jgi:hypothetical protein
MISRKGQLIGDFSRWIKILYNFNVSTKLPIVAISSPKLPKLVTVTSNDKNTFHKIINFFFLKKKNINKKKKLLYFLVLVLVFFFSIE